MITVYGEGLIDLVPRSPAQLAPLVPSLGGGPFNVARACGRLGCTTRFVSRLSTDAFGQSLVDALEEAGVDTSQLARGDEPTTLAVTSLAEDGSASYQFYVDGTADRFAEPQAATEGFASFGTVSLSLEPAASRYAVACKQSADNGVVVCLAEFERLDLDRDKLLALGEAEWREILTFAARAAAITVTRTGADTPTRDEVR